MFNVKSSVKGNVLTLEIDLGAAGRQSASGKSIVLASTQGNQTIGDVKVGLNVYKSTK